MWPLWIWLSLGEMLILKNFPVLEMIAQAPQVVGVLLQATVYRKSVRSKGALETPAGIRLALGDTLTGNPMLHLWLI